MPALYLAQEFSSRGDRILFVGSGRPLEAKLIDAAGFARKLIGFVGLKDRSLRSLAQIVLSFPRAMKQSVAVLREFNPDLVVGMGGYVTVPPVLAAYFLGIPTWIHEAELRPGRATRLLQCFATKISLAFAANPLVSRANSVVTGHPLRPEIANIEAWDSRRETISRILVVGGSQGASALDQAVPEILTKLNLPQIEVWHQCREQNVEQVKARYAQNNISSRVESFISDMCAAYVFADLIISRAGAGALMELGAVNRATILVPFPHAQGGHQLLNAHILSDAGKALLVEEGVDFSARLEAAVKSLLQPAVLRRMLDLPPPVRPLGATARIVEGCHALVAERAEVAKPTH